MVRRRNHQLQVAHRQTRAARSDVRKLKNALARSRPPYGSTPIEQNFLCIHSHEGPWTIHNPPYDGGLQMDRDFQQTYGDWAVRAFGSAGHWPISVQLAVAIRAYYSGRGYYPWPNTARMCGLLP